MRPNLIPLLFVGLTAIAAHVAAGETPANATPAPAAPGIRRHAGATAEIRHHKMRRLEYKLIGNPELAKTTCRYESELSNPAPLKTVALTFDDGPDPINTDLILATLKKHNVRASFFLIGNKAQRLPELVQKVRTAGHLVIGNHSWDHPDFHSISAQQQAEEVEKAAKVLPDDTQPKFFRYPFGNSSCPTNQLLHDQGYKIVGWHIDSCDWAFDRTGEVDNKEAVACGVAAAYRNNFPEHVLSAVRGHNGGIVLMHEIHTNTVKNLDHIISTLLNEGMSFGTVDEPAFAASLR